MILEVSVLVEIDTTDTDVEDLREEILKEAIKNIQDENTNEDVLILPTEY